MTKYDTREAWLLAAIEQLKPLFSEQGAKVPAVRVSVGWPGGKGKKSTTIGQCWSSLAAKDKVAQVFVSPVLDSVEQILAVLTHELVHAVDDCKSGHKGPFAKLAKGLGLIGKMTETTAGPELVEKLRTISGELGEYPHARLSAGVGGLGEPKQTTRMLKCECSECGYTARTTRKWLDEAGAPLCPKCTVELGEPVALVVEDKDAPKAPAKPKTAAITEQSKELFVAFCIEAPNWSGNPWTWTVTDKAGQGNLTQLKKAGLIETGEDDKDSFVIFTDKGIAYAAELGYTDLGL
jgi:hypothetical protein